MRECSVFKDQFQADDTCEANVRTGTNFKLNLNEIPKFRGDEDPRTHVRKLQAALPFKRVEPQMMVHVFPLSLEGSANA